MKPFRAVGTFNIPYRWTVGVTGEIIYKYMMYQVYHLQRAAILDLFKGLRQWR